MPHARHAGAVAGVATYGYADSQFSAQGTIFVAANTVVVVLETLSKRHLMTNATRPLQVRPPPSRTPPFLSPTHSPSHPTHTAP